MNNLETIARYLVLAGLVTAAAGGLLWLGARFLNLKNLPGTIRIETGGLTCIIPLLGSIVLSIVLTLVLNLIIRLFNR